MRGDLAAAISALRAKPGGELQVHGTGALIRWLLDARVCKGLKTLAAEPRCLGTTEDDL